jgi:hypothetical protein
LREEHKVRMFENRVLRKILGPRRNEMTGSGEDYSRRSFIICIYEPFVQSKQV